MESTNLQIRERIGWISECLSHGVSASSADTENDKTVETIDTSAKQCKGMQTRIGKCN